jgi:hypothetical protein
LVIDITPAAGNYMEMTMPNRLSGLLTDIGTDIEPFHSYVLCLNLLTLIVDQLKY